MLLTPDQLEILTGYRRPSAQVRALRRMGVRYLLRPDGRPVVDDSAITGRDASCEGPRFEARDTTADAPA
jgi:hypothetical protein